MASGTDEMSSVKVNHSAFVLPTMLGGGGTEREKTSIPPNSNNAGIAAPEGPFLSFHVLISYFLRGNETPQNLTRLKRSLPSDFNYVISISKSVELKDFPSFSNRYL